MYCLHEIIWDYVRCSVFQYILPRDIGGSDPERMAAPRVEEYVTQCFAGTKVEIHLPNTSQCFLQRSASRCRKARSSLRGNIPVSLLSIGLQAR